MTNKAETRRLDTIGDVSRALQVSERTIQNWMKRKMIPYLKIGRNVRFDLNEVLKALAKFEINPN